MWDGWLLSGLGVGAGIGLLSSDCLAWDVGKGGAWMRGIGIAGRSGGRTVSDRRQISKAVEIVM